MRIEELDRVMAEELEVGTVEETEAEELEKSQDCTPLQTLSGKTKTGPTLYYCQGTMLGTIWEVRVRH